MTTPVNYAKSLPQDLTAGLVVFLVALPLCLGVALASGAPPISGIVSGIVGGMLVVWISGSHTSVSGPAAGLTAVVLVQITTLGSFEAFLVAVILAGFLQLGLAALKTGALAAFFPSSVIKGLLAAIGIILILKQIPHLFGNDSDWLGDLSFQQVDGENTLYTIYQTLFNFQPGPTIIGLLSVVLLLVWDRTPLKKLPVPAPLLVVAIGIAMAWFISQSAGGWAIARDHLVQVPVTTTLAEFGRALYFPDFSAIVNPAIIMAAITIALVASLETLLNMIPLSCLAAILMVTGFKLASPDLARQMWREGHSQFIPFATTIVAIVFTDLLIGTLIGLGVASTFILQGNLRRPLRKTIESNLSGDVTRIELAQHVSFLNRAALRKSLYDLPEGSSVVLDARDTIYVDPDIIDLIGEFERDFAPARGLTVSRVGLKDHYDLDDFIAYPEVTTKALQTDTTPDTVLQRMKDGNARYVAGNLSVRDHLRQLDMTATGQYPLAVVLACMDSRVHAEKIFDLGLGDMFSVRIAGNIVSEEALGSIEYGCAIAGAKVVMVLGHTRCGAVNATIDQLSDSENPGEDPGCENLGSITSPIAECVRAETQTQSERNSGNEPFVKRVTELNVLQSLHSVRKESTKLSEMIDDGKVLLCGGIYNVETGVVEIVEP